MIAVYRREVGSYFKGVLGYLLGAFLLVFAGIYCMVYNLSGYYSNFEYVLSGIGFIYLIAVPVISMRSVAEEKKQKTDQLLYSLPISLSSVVVGKYLAMLTVLALPIGIMALYPLILSQFGTVAYGTAYAGLLAFFLMGGCLLSVGLFISSITDSQVAAAVITLLTMLLLYFMSSLASWVPTDSAASLNALMVLAVIAAAVFYIMSKNVIVSVIVGAALIGGLQLWYHLDSLAFSGLFASMMNAISVFERFDTFVNGVFDVTAIVYYLSIIGVMLFLTTQAMEKRRWSE